MCPVFNANILRLLKTTKIFSTVCKSKRLEALIWNSAFGLVLASMAWSHLISYPRLFLFLSLTSRGNLSRCSHNPWVPQNPRWKSLEYNVKYFFLTSTLWCLFFINKSVYTKYMN